MDTGTEMFRVGAGAVGASMWNTVKDYFGRMCKVGSYIEKAFAVFDYAKKTCGGNVRSFLWVDYEYV